MLDRFRICGGDISVKSDHSGKLDLRLLSHADKLDTLRSRIRTLIVLTRKILRSEYESRIRQIRFFCDSIEGRFCENIKNRFAIELIAETVHIVPVEYANAFQPFNAEVFSDIGTETLRFDIKALFLFNEDSSYHVFLLNL